MLQDRIACPHCGGRLDDTVTIKAGIYSYSGPAGFRVGGQPLAIGKQAGDVLGIIMQARGNNLDADAIAEALDSSAMDSRNLVSVQLARAKRLFEDIGATWPIGHRRALGWYWSGPSVTTSS